MLRPTQGNSRQRVVVWIAAMFLLTGTSAADDQLPAEGKVASVNGFQMYYEIHGEGEPLVLLHGFFGSGEFWQPLVADLANDYRLVIPDLRKHGRSTDPGGIFTHRQAAKDVFALLDHLKIKECRAIGFSTGGMTLLHMATSQPDRLKSMVLIGAASYLPKVARNYRQITFDDFTNGPLASLKEFHVRGDDQIRELLRCWYAFEHNYDDMNFSPPFLSTIKASTLIVYGDRDEYFPVEIALEMYRSIPDAYLWVVPNGRHVPDFENPREFVTRFREFLQGKWRLPTALPEKVGVNAEIADTLSQSMQTLVDQGKISGGVTMLARHGKVVHNEAVGYLDLGTKRPMPTDAIFRIASMTKPITSVAVMMLWEQGELELDDPVSKHIPAFKSPTVLESRESLDATKPAKNEITIRHLLTHTSGLSYEFAKPLGPLYHQHGIHCGSCTVDETLEDMINKLGPLPLRFNPGQEWHYGMNYAVLGRIVEVVSGMPFDRYVEQQICRPLRMQDTYFKIPNAKLDRLAAAYVPSGDSIRRMKDGEMLNWKLTDLGGGDILMSCDYPYSEANKCVLGGGNLCSTPADYMRFCQMLLNEGELDGVRLLQADTVKMMTANQVGDLRGEEGYGFGFGITPEAANIPEQLRGSYYWYGGWTTSFHISPRGDWILVTMTQVAWNDLAPNWFAKYEQIAAESIID